IDARSDKWQKSTASRAAADVARSTLSRLYACYGATRARLRVRCAASHESCEVGACDHGLIELDVPLDQLQGAGGPAQKVAAAAANQVRLGNRRILAIHQNAAVDLERIRGRSPASTNIAHETPDEGRGIFSESQLRIGNLIDAGHNVDQAVV